MIQICLLLIIALGISSAITYPPNRKWCALERDLNANKNCSSPQNPVCGYAYQGNLTCTNEPCTQDFNNTCQACLDMRIEFWKDGPCELNKTIDYCTDQERGVVCENQNGLNLANGILQDPVCGYLFENKQEAIYPNRCYACADKTVDYTKHGLCLPDKFNTTDLLNKYIKDQSRYFCPVTQSGLQVVNDCSTVMNGPVCGLLSTFPDRQDYDNWCLACNDPKINTYLQGDCNRTDLNTDYCTNDDKLNRVPCDPLIAPVCGVQGRLVNTQILNKGNYDNRCQACKDPTVDYVVKGECVLSIPVIFDIPIVNPMTVAELVPGDQKGITVCTQTDHLANCTNNNAIPTCGMYKICPPTGDCFKTYQNQCFACQDSFVDAAIDGSCEINMDFLNQLKVLWRRRNPKPQVMCKTRKTNCTIDIDPVCAFKKNCTANEPCYITTTNQCQACKDTTNEFYYSGACQESEMASC